MSATTRITSGDITSVIESHDILDTRDDVSVASYSTISSKDYEPPHEPVRQDSLFLNLDAGEGFELDVNTVLTSSPSQNIEELRLFLSPHLDWSNMDLYHYDSIVKSKVESILNKFPTISRLYIHVGVDRGDGFEQGAMYCTFDKGRLTTITSLLLPLFQKQPLSTLSVGGYQVRDGTMGTYPGSEVVPAGFANIAEFGNALAHLETLDMGIGFSTSGSATTQRNEAVTNADIFGDFMEKIPTLKDLSIRWDCPYGRDEVRSGRRVQIPVDLQLEFCSRLVQNLKTTRSLQRLFLRGFDHIYRDVMHSFLSQNEQLEKIEIGIWSCCYSYWNIYAEVHHINYVSAVRKVDHTPYTDSVWGRKSGQYEVTRWKEGGFLTSYEMCSDDAEDTAALDGELTLPATSNGRAERVLDLLTDCKLVWLHDSGDLSKRRVMNSGHIGNVALTDVDAKVSASSHGSFGETHKIVKRTSTQRNPRSPRYRDIQGQHRVRKGRISEARR